MNWIWLDSEKFPEQQTCRKTIFCKTAESDCPFAVAEFVKDFNVEDELQSAKLIISADTSYVLYINGKKVIKGPAVVGGDYNLQNSLSYYFYDEIDIKDHLKRGVNTACVKVALGMRVMADYSKGHGGLTFNLTLSHSNGTNSTVCADESWKSKVLEEYTTFRSYDDTKKTEKYYPSVITKNLWENLLPKEIPDLREEIIPYKKIICDKMDRIVENDGKLLIKKGDKFSIIFEFDKLYSAFTLLKTKGGAGTAIDIICSETPTEIKRSEDIIISDETDYEGIMLQSCRYVELYFKNGVSSDIEMDFKLNFTSYPVNKLGSFECNDEFLNKLYNVCCHTNQICMQSYHMDSPTHQEALGCTGDYYIESKMNYYSFGDKWLTRLDLLRTGMLLEETDAVMFHTSYSLLFTEMLMDYYLFTGDDELFYKLKKPLEMLMNRFISYIGETGTMDHPINFMFIDWAVVGDIWLHHPPRCLGQTCMTAFFYKAVKNCAFIFGYIGEDKKKAEYEKIAADVKINFNKHFWVEERGLYKDGLRDTKYVERPWCCDADIVNFSQHSNSLAVLYGLCDESKKADIMEKVITDSTLTQAQPYFMHFVLSALAESGLFYKYGNEQMRRWKHSLDKADTSLEEMWDHPGCDFSHAWGGTPQLQMSAVVLGIVPKSPGFKTVSIKPCLGDLEYAKGTVPTPYGLIEVSVKKGEEPVIKLPNGVKLV